MRNTSLDEFLDIDEAAEAGVADERAESDSDGEESVVDAPDTDSVEPAVSTYDWTPSGAECEDCGGVVERRWRDDGRLVCPDCKDW